MIATTGFVGEGMIAVLLSRAALTLEAAAELLGVTPRTVRNWRDGKTPTPYHVVAALTTAAEQAELVAEATADHAEWIAGMDEDTAERAPAATLDEQIWMLRGIQNMQAQAMHRMEDDLAEARIAHGQTTSKLNALYAERGKLENRK